MNKVTFYKEKQVPLEFHKTRIVQQVNLIPIYERHKKITEAGNNLFLMHNDDIYLDMLTDSGVNAMSDKMQSAMLIADDSYAGSATFSRMEDKMKEIFDMDYFLPAHQGRACENILFSHFVSPNDIIPMNYRFDSTKEHISRAKAYYKEFIIKEGLTTFSDVPFKGNFDIEKLHNFLEENGTDNVSFVRIEAGTNLIGGQPISLDNMREVSALCKQYNLMVVFDASLLQDNLYFIKQRESKYRDWTLKAITHEIAGLMDIIYFSSRKLGFGRGGGICVRDKKHYIALRDYVAAFEGFTTYGGMSVREMEAITVGLDETMDDNVVSQGPLFIEYMANKLFEYGIPVVLPAGGLGVHIDAAQFLPHIPKEEYPAGALASALYIASGVRAMERGTLSESRLENGDERISEMELVRVALPRRVFSLSQVNYTIDRIKWLYDNRELIHGLKFINEPKTLRFYFGHLIPVNDWQDKLIAKFTKDFPDSL